MSKKDNASGNKLKTKARLFALQFLYSQEINKKTVMHDKNHSIFAEFSVQNYDQNYAQELIKGVEHNSVLLEDHIYRNLSNNWTIAKLDLLIKINFKLATYELAFIFDLPAKVILDEYVNLIGSFYENDKELGFVNAVLHKIAQNLRNKEMIE